MSILQTTGKKINQISNNQKTLYFIFICILMVTNTILLFTEPMSTPAKMAFILLPLGVQMLLLAWVKKPGTMFLILIPKSILDAFQLVLIKLYGGSIIAVDMFLNLVTTSATEAGELLANMIPVILFLLIIYIPAIILAIRSIKNKVKIPELFKRRALRASGGIIALGAIFLVISQYTKDGFYIKYDLYPVNVMYNMDFAVKKWNKVNNYKETSKDFTFEATRDTSTRANHREIYVLLIGETARAENWSLYGYERKTTPNVDTLSNLIKFKDALSQSNTTHKSVPLLLTPADADNHNMVYSCKSIVTLFNEADFKTVYLTNHEYQQSFMENYFEEADIAISVKDALNNSYDYQMVDSLDCILREDTTSNLFIVVHLYGSHFNYHQRYTREFAKFQPDVAEVISKKYKQELINSYDNSILSTDYIIGEIIGRIRDQHAKSFVVYTSDHGEDILDDKRERFLHASPIPTFYQIHVPFIIWFSNEYKTTDKEKYANTLLRANDPVSTNGCIFHTVTDLASIHTSFLNTEQSLCSKDFKIAPRKYLTDHDGSIRIDELLLTKYDYEQFEKRGITLH